jgi:hypothetical protein
MVELAQAKGWIKLNLSGSDDFKREAWLEASLRDLEITGYEARDVDKARLAELLQERGARGDDKATPSTTAPNSISNAAREPSPDVEQAVSDERKLTPQQATAVAALKTILKNRGDSDQEIAAAVSIATERFQNNRVYVGKLMEHGSAPYEFNKDNENNYFVRLETAQGEKVIWGIDLNRATAVAEAREGDDVALAFQGKQAVTVTVKERDPTGRVTGQREIVTDRNTWSVEKAEQLRADAKVWLNTAAERTAQQPVVKMFDPKAPRQTMRAPAKPTQTHEQDRGR